MLFLLFELFSSQHIFVLTTTGTTITTHRSKTDLDLCHLCNLCELLYTNGLELTIKNYKFIIDNLWKFTGISVKYKTQIGTNDHKLSKNLFTQTGRLIWKFQVSGSKFKRRSIVYTPTLPHSYTPKKLLTYHFSLRQPSHLSLLFRLHMDSHMGLGTVVLPEQTFHLGGFLMGLA